MDPKVFAELVHSAQEMHEASWNGYEYTVDHSKAAENVCRARQLHIAWAQPVALLNRMAWNDIQSWANEQTKPQA